MYFGHTYQSKSYVIGFRDPMHAWSVCKKLGPHPKLRLRRNEYQDISRDINDGLLDFGIVFDINNVTIDMDALLEISWDKKNTRQSSLEYDVYDLREEVLISYPFEKCVGIIFPERLLRNKGEESFKFVCNVIDPVENIELFRSSLKM